jgi:hypothetical protein
MGPQDPRFLWKKSTDDKPCDDATENLGGTSGIRLDQSFGESGNPREFSEVPVG